MGCCSGNGESSKGGNQYSVKNESRINLDNYTHFPGAIKQTDYTNSQARTGWASEMDRKRNISQTIYYNPSYVFLANHGNDESNLRCSGSIFSSTYFSNLKKNKKDVEYESIGSFKKNCNTDDKNDRRQRNYFGKI